LLSWQKGWEEFARNNQIRHPVEFFLPPPTILAVDLTVSAGCLFFIVLRANKHKKRDFSMNSVNMIRTLPTPLVALLQSQQNEIAMYKWIEGE
jgi:hypothetical protein